MKDINNINDKYNLNHETNEINQTNQNDQNDQNNQADKINQNNPNNKFKYTENVNQSPNISSQNSAGYSVNNRGYFNTEALINSVVLTMYLFMTAYLLVTGEILLYIHPKMIKFVYFLVSILGILAISEIWRFARNIFIPRKYKHNLGIWLFMVPLALFGTVEHGVAFTAETSPPVNVAGSSAGINYLSSNPDFNITDDAIKFSTVLFGSYQMPEQFDGMEVELIGFIYDINQENASELGSGSTDGANGSGTTDSATEYEHSVLTMEGGEIVQNNLHTSENNDYVNVYSDYDSANTASLEINSEINPEINSLEITPEIIQETMPETESDSELEIGFDEETKQKFKESNPELFPEEQITENYEKAELSGKSVCRMLITCCAADAMVAGIDIVGDIAELKPNQWYKLKGRVHTKLSYSETYGMEITIPVLTVTEYSEETQPSNPYIYQ